MQKGGVISHQKTLTLFVSSQLHNEQHTKITLSYKQKSSQMITPSNLINTEDIVLSTTIQTSHANRRPHYSFEKMGNFLSHQLNLGLLHDPIHAAIQSVKNEADENARLTRLKYERRKQRYGEDARRRDQHGKSI